MENNKKEEPETRSYASSSINLPSDPEELTKVFKKNLEGLENLVKLFKSDHVGVCGSSANFPQNISCKITQNKESKMSSSSTLADREFGMGLRPALELEDYIKKLYDRKARVNLGDFLVKK
ncbi:unnamed protein product [Rhizophagus irregularis]|nr:unnamed protein product [Rhizophagus irregularis]